MDGTLWDAVDSYSEVWNETFRELGLKAEPVTRDRLMRTMGLPLDKILAIIAPDLADKDRFLKVLDKNEAPATWPPFSTPAPLMWRCIFPRR